MDDGKNAGSRVSIENISLPRSAASCSRVTIFSRLCDRLASVDVLGKRSATNVFFNEQVQVSERLEFTLTVGTIVPGSGRCVSVRRNVCLVSSSIPSHSYHGETLRKASLPEGPGREVSDR